MQFKPEYMTDELSGILNVVLSYSSDTVYEEYHVVKAIDRCAKELAQTVLKQYRSLTMFQRVNPTLFDTDWYIHSNMEPDRPIEDTFISKEQSNHRIMFSFQKLNPMTDMQNDLRELPYNDVEIENLRTHNFSEDLKTDNPLIIINTAFMDWVRLDQKERMIILSGMLAHELRHVVEQYVLEFRNTIMTVEGSLNYDFKHNNIFELDTNSEVYKILKDIIYYMSLEEQRARIQAVWNVCQDAILNNAYRSQLTAAYYRTLSLMYRNDMVPGDDNFRMEIISALRSNPLKYVHLLAGFRRTVNELALIKRPETYKILLVLGYFLEKHGYIKSGNDALVKKFFSKDVVMMKLEEPFSEVDRNFYEVVMNVVQLNYRRYENIVYNVIGMNIEHIFQYKKPDNNTVVKFSRLAADSDLKLKDYEVGLINEAFNLYADAKNRWLNNINNV